MLQLHVHIDLKEHPAPTLAITVRDTVNYHVVQYHRTEVGRGQRAEGREVGTMTSWIYIRKGIISDTHSKRIML